LRGFFTQRVPPFRRILLVESGSRRILDRLIPHLFEVHGETLEIDLVTCFGDAPQAFRGKIFNVNEYRGRDARRRLYSTLAARHYDLAGIVCSAEPLMTKWKWALAWKLDAKLFVVNENCDYFCVHWPQTRTIVHFALFRAGLTGGAAIPTIARLLFFPFVLAYLLAYAAVVHLRRKLRTL